MNDTYIIQAENLTKKYLNGKFFSLDDVSFKVRRGESFALLGPNGAGKTTTMSILTTTLQKTSGKVKIVGYDLDQAANKVRQNIGVIFQRPSLDDNLSAEENIRFHAAIYGLFPFSPIFSQMPEAYKNRLFELAEILNIEKDIFKKISEFSGGMKRRLEIIRGLMHKPKILFLDEPTTGIDPINRKNLWDYLNLVKKEEGVTIFFTTHYLDEVEHSDTMCIIDSGKIIVNDSPDKVKEKFLKGNIIIKVAEEYHKALQEELKKLGYKYIQSGKNELSLDTVGKNPLDVAKQLSIPINSIKVDNPTLEEVYLRIIAQNAR